MTWPCLGRGRVGGALPGMASADTGDTDHDVMSSPSSDRSRAGAGGGGQVRGGSRAWPHLLQSAQTEQAETRKWAISGHGEWELNTPAILCSDTQ